ncbi:hypothetical protein, partial [Ferrovibrio sp.]|uniref:hypothetical protein n=1 Tax=Ferrovibrio sp. TaxID=1917215 RepID=UPI0025BF3E91
MTSENDKRTITFIAAPGIEQKFDTVQSLKAFFKKEWDEHWEPILLPGFFNGLNQSIVNRLYETQAYLLDGLKPNYDKIQALDENSSNDDINKIFDFFSSDRQNFRGLVSLNPDDATILSFKNSNKIAALMGVVIRTKGYLRNTLRRINQEDVVRECFKGIAEFSASINTTPIFQQVWESLFTLADQERSIVKSDVESWISKIQKQHDAFTEALNLAYENFHKSRETQNKQNQLLNEVMQNHTLALNEITAKYNEHMKLEAPVTYWMAKVDELKKTRDDAFKQFRNTAIYVAIIAAALT